MNRKDIQQLAKSGKVEEQKTEQKKPDVEAAVAKFFSSMPSSRVKDDAWFRLYCAVVGGQAGWLTSATTSELMVKRLTILADIADAAVNFAVNRKKVSK